MIEKTEKKKSVMLDLKNITKEKGEIKIMRKKKLDNTIIEIRMIDRYKQINKFRYSIFAICNPSTPMEAIFNPIMTEMVLDKLKELREEIKEDINCIKLESIKVEDIFGSREAEVSELLVKETCLYDFQYYREKYDRYLSGKALERVYPISKREKMIEKFNTEIVALEETVNDLEIIDKQLAKEEKRNLEALIGKKQEFEDKFYFPTLEEIQASLHIRVNSYLNNILEDVEKKIEYLERGLA